jgi:hypothetical protein
MPVSSIQRSRRSVNSAPVMSAKITGVSQRPGGLTAAAGEAAGLCARRGTDLRPGHDVSQFNGSVRGIRI